MHRTDNDDAAVCTRCGTVVENAEDWDKYHRHGR